MVPAIREFLQANAWLDSAIAQVASSRAGDPRARSPAWAYALVAALSAASVRSGRTWDVDIRHGGSCQQLPTSRWRRERWTLSSSAARKRRAAMRIHLRDDLMYAGYRRRIIH